MGSLLMTINFPLLVRFPAIARIVESRPSDVELQGGSSIAVAAVSKDRLNDELLLIVLTVAQHNEQEFIVESILGHRGNRNRRSALQFNVRWSEFDDSSDSWEAYKALMHVDKLHDYLRSNAMKTPCFDCLIDLQGRGAL